MYRTCDDEFYNEDDATFDHMLEEKGFIIVTKTSKNRHFRSPIENGVRSAQVIRGDNHIDREHVWYDSKGQGHKWYLEYQNQPHNCTRGCKTFHEDGKCQAWEKKVEKKSWAGQQKCFFVSSSLLRLASDTKDTRIDVIPGAKIGHLSNHVNNDATIFEKAETLVIYAGANMDMGSVEKSKPHIEAQAQELTQVLGPLVEAEKKVFVVDPVCGPLVKEAPGADHWALLRSRMKKVAKKIKGEWVSLENVNWVSEEDVAPDGVHYSKSGTQKVMEAIATKVKAVTGQEIMEGMVIQDRPYAEVSRQHYRVGCNRCTRSHDGRECPPLPSLDDSNLSSSNTTLLDTFHSADNDSLESSEDLPAASSSPKNDSIENVLTHSGELIHLEAPELRSAYSVLLRSQSSSSSRSPSVQKRELDKSKESTPEASRKRPKTKTDSQQQKGHVSRNGIEKQSKK